MEDTELFRRKIIDAVKLAHAGTDRFTFFLSENEIEIATGILISQKFSNYMFYGGTDQSERRMLGCFAQGSVPCADKFPLAAVTASFSDRFSLTHRDFLGALTALGIRRDGIGDILISPGTAVIFVAESLKKHLLADFDKAGRVGVKPSEGMPEGFISEQNFSEHFGSVASPRLDAVVALLTNLSRSDAAGLIERDLVRVNGAVVNSGTKLLREQSAVSVRGYGKFYIDDTSGLTKKGRVKINYRKLL